MIVKSYEFKKIDLKKNRLFLLYGSNEGAKKEVLEEIINQLKIDNIISYDEKQILENEDIFFNEVSSESLFSNKKVIIIKRASNKILKYVEKIFEKNLDNTYIFINANELEKKAKLRTLFEKEKNPICIPFYSDTKETLSKIAINFLKKNNINISQSNINLVVDRANGDRGILKNELVKIELYSIKKKQISTEAILKLINLTENHVLSELIDNCLAKNFKKTIHILNENNYSDEDTILIIRTLLNKSKKILKLTREFEQNKNIELTISLAKPPIFWKEKEITKQQVYKWTPKKIQSLIYKLNNIELIAKKNLKNSINLISDFILEQSATTTNN